MGICKYTNRSPNRTRNDNDRRQQNYLKKNEKTKFLRTIRFARKMRGKKMNKTTQKRMKKKVGEKAHKTNEKIKTAPKPQRYTYKREKKNHDAV